MHRSRTRGSLAAVVTALAMLATPLPVLADFAINIVGPGPYGGAGITVADNTAGDLSPLPGVIVLTAGAGTPAIPGFSFSVDVGITNSPGGPAFSLVDLNWTLGTLVPGDLGGTIVVTASADDFTFPPTGGGSTLTSSIGGTIAPTGGSNSVTAQQWVDLTNLLFGLGAVTTGVQGPFTSPSFNSTVSTGFTSVTPYSITDQLILSLGPNALTTGNLQSTVVPEPVTMFLGGTGLLLLGYAARGRLFGR